MSEIKLGIIGGGQLGSMLSDAAKKLNIKTVIYCDDLDAPAKNFCDEFIFGKYDEKEKIIRLLKQNKLPSFLGCIIGAYSHHAIDYIWYDWGTHGIY